MRSSGQYVWFLNGGDTSIVSEWALLERELTRSSSDLLFASYLLQTGDRRISRESRPASYIWHGLPTSHQAIFYPGSVIREAKYDLTYRIVGDYEVTARMLRRGTPSRVLKLPVAAFLTGGMSQAHSHLIAVEAGRVQHEVLHLARSSRILSQIRHKLSSFRRDFQTRT